MLNRLKFRRPRTSLCFFIFILTILAVLSPVFYTLITSYIKLSYFSFFDPRQISVYFTLFTDNRELILFSRSLILAFGTVLLSLVFGIPLAFLFERTTLPFKRIFKAFCLVPLLIPPYITTISWMQMFGTNAYLNHLPIYNLPTTILILSLSYFPIALLLISAGLKRINMNLEDAARLFSTPKKVFSKITLPLLLPYILTASLFIFVLAISEFGVPSLLHQNVFTSEIFFQFGAFFNHEKAVSKTIPLLVLLLLLIGIQGLYLGKKSFGTISSSFKRKEIKLSKKSESLSILFVLFVLFFSFIIPIGSFFYVSSLSGFLYAVKTSYMSIFNSFWLALFGSILITILSFFIAYFLNHVSLIKKRFWEVVSLLPLIIPSSVVGISLIHLWNNSYTSLIYSSFLIVILGYLARFLPFGIKITSSSFEQLKTSLEESAILTGSSFSKIIRKILIPLTAPGIISSFIVAFILCIRELGATLLISPPGLETLPIRIYNLVHYGAPESVASLCLILIALIVIPILLIFILIKYFRRKRL